MNQLLAYLDRIQGRLLAAFASVLLGTVVIWYVSWNTLNDFTADVAEQMSQTQVAGSSALRLQSAILEQIANGEHYFITRDRQTITEFDSLGTEVSTHIKTYANLEGGTQEETQDLASIAQLHHQIQALYIGARNDMDGGREDAARAKVEEVSPLT